MYDITTQLITDLLRRRSCVEILFKIGGLRAVAVAPVVLFHTGVVVLQGGFVGSDEFFVISGYLIGLLILHECAAGTIVLVGFANAVRADYFPHFWWAVWGACHSHSRGRCPKI